MRILSYHHKGGVGKSTTAVHVALRLLGSGRRVLVVDGDSQAHSCAFLGVDPAAAEDAPVAVPAAGALHVVHAEHKKIRQQPKRVGADDVVMDLSANLEQVGTVARTLEPEVVLICVKPNTGALRDLQKVVATFVRETDADVRVVPIGVPEAEIRAALAGLPDAAYTVMPPVSYVPDEAERSFAEHRPVWTFEGCEGMGAEYDALTA